jgi:peptide/nickel transport system substrate-binding protein
MKRTAFRWIAAASLLIVASTHAARRPRYGGDLRIETRALLRSMDPTEWPVETSEEFPWLTSAVFETLVRLDARGEPQPWLAISWTHDAVRKSWIFTPRPNVVLQNGATWAPAPIVIPDERPIEQILRDLSRPKNAIVIRSADGALTGTGAFRIARWQASRSATLAAHDGYWGGRPYLDSVQIQFGREYADQAADLQLGKADVIDANLPVKKAAATRATATLALQFDGRVPDAVREAIALAIDRASIHSVILQKQGDASAALLPQWLSGYALVFPTERNLAKARQLVPSPVNLNWSYDAKNPLVRSIAQRIEVNVREIGITLHSSLGGGDATLLVLPVTSAGSEIALEDMAAMLKMPFTPSSSYESERALLNGFRVIPIVQLPRVWSLSAHVHNWPRLEEVWIE